MTHHLFTATPTHNCWSRIKQACHNPANPRYKNYGAKGIALCDEWKDNFAQFIKDMGEMPAGFNTIDRHDKNENFCKFNCFWSYVSVGRKKNSAKKTEKKVLKRGQFKKSVTICLALEKEHRDYIYRQAAHKSAQLGYKIEPNQLIREALHKAFPTPKQRDMFGGEIKA